MAIRCYQLTYISNLLKTVLSELQLLTEIHLYRSLKVTFLKQINYFIFNYIQISFPIRENSRLNLMVR